MLTKLLLIFLLFNVIFSLTTHDPEFEKKFKVEHIKEGDGKTFPKKYSLVFVHYTGSLLDGTKIDSTYERNRPYGFTLGVGRNIKCLDMVVERLSLGEKISVICPYDLAYGDKGHGKMIPPNSDLKFEIELMKIHEEHDDL